MNQAVKLDTNPSLALVAQLAHSELAAQPEKLKLSIVHPKFEGWSCYHILSTPEWISNSHYIGLGMESSAVYLYKTVVESTSVLPLSTKERSE
jgi:hypothetical protein